jgi:AraC-like DNA-binding protein
LARLAYERVKQAGVHIEPLLKGTSITRRHLDNADQPIKVSDQIHFLNSASVALNDSILGFHLAERFEPREIGLLHYVIASSDKLADALQRAARYSSLVNDGIAIGVNNGQALQIAFRYVGVSRHLDRHQIEFWITTLIRMCRQLTGVRLKPPKVRMMHHREHNAELSGFFGDDIEFSADSDQITFASRVGSMPLVTGDPFLNRLLVSYCEEAVARRPRRSSSLRSRVENAAAQLLPHGKARAVEIARQLGLSSRTLARKLSVEGLSMSCILADLRRDLARRHLADDELRISQIAWLVGYRDVAAFSHAYKRWTGKAPRAARSNGRSHAMEKGDRPERERPPSPINRHRPGTDER